MTCIIQEHITDAQISRVSISILDKIEELLADVRSETIVLTN